MKQVYSISDYTKKGTIRIAVKGIKGGFRPNFNFVIYRLFRDLHIQGKLGKRSNVAVILARNVNQSLETDIDGKYIDDGLVKLSKTLRDMLYKLVNQIPR